MAAKKEALSNAVLDAVLRGVAYQSPAELFCALFTEAGTPTSDGVEVAASEYMRQPVLFIPAVAGTTSNAIVVVFPVAEVPWGNIVGTAICDAVTGGQQLYFGNLAVAKNLDVGDQLSFAVGALLVRES